MLPVDGLNLGTNIWSAVGAIAKVYCYLEGFYGFE